MSGAVTVTISIGRNIGSAPMPGPEWRRFRRTVSEALSGGPVFVGDARTVGQWEGVAEESRTWVASVEADAVDVLLQSMQCLARTYCQDAIAVTVGHTVLAS